MQRSTRRFGQSILDLSLIESFLTSINCANVMDSFSTFTLSSCFIVTLEGSIIGFLAMFRLKLLNTFENSLLWISFGIFKQRYSDTTKQKNSESLWKAEIFRYYSTVFTSVSRRSCLHYWLDMKHNVCNSCNFRPIRELRPNLSF